jgi:hypothetical protein
MFNFPSMAVQRIANVVLEVFEIVNLLLYFLCKNKKLLDS